MIKICRTAKGKTYRASQLPSEMDNNGAVWTNQGYSEDYNVHYNAWTKKFSVYLVEWDDETEEWTPTEIPENEHPDLIVYIP